ncbi:MAG: fumarate hydratase [Bacillota bacterium]|jgi:fumarate hydratase subunit alpha
MRTVQAEEIAAAVARLCREANVALGADVLNALKEALKHEESPQGKDVLEKLLANAALAREENIPLCQDTGVAVVFLEVGQEVCIAGSGNRK